MASLMGFGLEELGSVVSVDEKVLASFKQRVSQGDLVRELNPVDHVCSFFVPVHKNSRSMYLGHHKKADLWLPPGGHIELNESSEECVRREFEEELGVDIGESKISLVGLTVTDILPMKNRSCRRHWDLWYGVSMRKRQDFKFDRGEFFDAEWLVEDEVLDKIGLGNIYTPVIKSLWRNL